MRTEHVNLLWPSWGFVQLQSIAVFFSSPQWDVGKIILTSRVGNWHALMTWFVIAVCTWITTPQIPLHSSCSCELEYLGTILVWTISVWVWRIPSARLDSVFSWLPLGTAIKSLRCSKLMWALCAQIHLYLVVHDIVCKKYWWRCVEWWDWAMCSKYRHHFKFDTVNTFGRANVIFQRER